MNGKQNSKLKKLKNIKKILKKKILEKNKKILEVFPVTIFVTNY
jgi:hypothetical protein